MCIRDRISLGKASDLHTKRQVYAYITKEDVAKKLFDVQVACLAKADHLLGHGTNVLSASDSGLNLAIL